MDYVVVNNCLISIEAALRQLKFEVSASKAEESPATTGNSDYMAALRVFEEYVAYKDKRGDSVIDFPIWLGQRLNSAKAPNCT